MRKFWGTWEINSCALDIPKRRSQLAIFFRTTTNKRFGTTSVACYSRSFDRVSTQADTIGVARAKGAMATPKFLENIVILCFERRFSKQNSVIRLQSNILPPQHFWAGYATG